MISTLRCRRSYCVDSRIRIERSPFARHARLPLVERKQSALVASRARSDRNGRAGFHQLGLCVGDCDQVRARKSSAASTLFRRGRRQWVHRAADTIRARCCRGDFAEASHRSVRSNAARSVCCREARYRNTRSINGTIRSANHLDMTKNLFMQRESRTLPADSRSEHLLDRLRSRTWGNAERNLHPRATTRPPTSMGTLFRICPSP